MNGKIDAQQRFRDLLRSAMISASPTANPIRIEVEKHFASDLSRMAVVARLTDRHLWLVRQVGIDSLLAEEGCTSRTHGYVVPEFGYINLGEVLLPSTLPKAGGAWGPVQEERVEAGYQKWTSVLTNAIVLFRDGDGPAVLFLCGASMEVMAPTPDRALAILDDIERWGLARSPYRGACINVFAWDYSIRPQFEARPSDVTRDDVVLPEGVLELVEGHVLGISRFAHPLTTAGRHLKRGLLLWGRPGTGKTHTIRYLASQLPDHTVLTLPGTRLEHLRQMAELLPYCAPAIVVLDDVDYIAEDRSLPSMAPPAMLFELLETLDGFAPDADVLFVLTTNRPETLEPAVAARPGRVDQVVEIPAPDESCRRRLFDLYGKGVALELDDGERDVVIERTGGVTGSFFKELLRRATLAAASADRRTADGRLVVGAADIGTSLDEMLDPANTLTPGLRGESRESHGNGEPSRPAEAGDSAGERAAGARAAGA